MWRLCLVVIAVSCVAFAGTGKITGVVVDEYGVPVPHIQVEACPDGVGFDLILPRAMTDEKGRFFLKITIPEPEATDRWAVYAYDEDERPEHQAGFYPRPSRFLGNMDSRHHPVVRISPKSPEATTEVVLPEKAGALRGRVRGVPDIPVVPTFEFVRLSDPEWHDQSIFENNRSPYRILVPANTTLSLKVTSPGYKPWTREVISVGSGQEMTLDIRLAPENR